MKKKFLIAFMVVCTLIMAIGIINASAETYGDLTYSVSNGNVIITDCNTSVTSVEIPLTINGYPVTEIGSYAFENCLKLETLTLSNNIIKIDSYAFGNCSRLYDIAIPNSVISIGRNAFYKTAYYNDSNNWENNVLYLDKHLINAKTSISGSYEIKLDTKSIAEAAFFECSKLTGINIPDSISRIEFNTFYKCTSLKDIKLPSSLTRIGGQAFYGCSSLGDIYLPKSIESMSISVFCKCSSLKSIVLPPKMSSIPEQTFDGCLSLTNISIPNSVIKIGLRAFAGCNSLTKVCYAGTEEEWGNVRILNVNDGLLNAEIIYNYQGASADVEITNATSTENSLKFISKAIIQGEPEIATFGTTFIPLWLFEENSTDVATVEYNNEDCNIQNGQTFGATLTGIPESFKDVKIVGKSYIKTVDGNYKWSSAKYATVNNTTLNTIE